MLAVEKKSVAKLQDPRTIKKILALDTHVLMTFAGLQADARILTNKARIECQSHRLTVEDPVTTEYLARYVAGVQQKYTQSGGVRPFGISTLMIGFDKKAPTAQVKARWEPKLYQTDPSGVFSEWKACAIGRSSKTVREFLEKNYPAVQESVAAKPETDEYEAVKLAVRALLEVVQTGAKNIEVAIMTCPYSKPAVAPAGPSQGAAPGDDDDDSAIHGKHVSVRHMEQDEIEKMVKQIEKEKEEEAEAKKKKAGLTASQQPTGML